MKKYINKYSIYNIVICSTLLFIVDEFVTKNYLKTSLFFIIIFSFIFFKALIDFINEL